MTLDTENNDVGFYPALRGGIARLWQQTTTGFGTPTILGHLPLHDHLRQQTRHYVGYCDQICRKLYIAYQAIIKELRLMQDCECRHEERGWEKIKKENLNPQFMNRNSLLPILCQNAGPQCAHRNGTWIPDPLGAPLRDILSCNIIQREPWFHWYCETSRRIAKYDLLVGYRTLQPLERTEKQKIITDNLRRNAEILLRSTYTAMRAMVTEGACTLCCMDPENPISAELAQEILKSERQQIADIVEMVWDRSLPIFIDT